MLVRQLADASRKNRDVTKKVKYCSVENILYACGTPSFQDICLNKSKRFFMLLHHFLARRYTTIDLVFIRHTHEAKEVDEETFFYSTETGGTVVSTALIRMHEIIKERYPSGEWNIYAAQASDGDDWTGDAVKCREILDRDLMPVCQHYAYVEILDERERETFANENNGAELWLAYRELGKKWANFATKRIARPGDIFPVFRELFSKQPKRV